MKLSPERRRQRADLVKFSVFLSVAVAFTLWVAAVTGEYRPDDRSSYRAVFDNVSGLAVGDEVRIAGVDVGKVEEIDVQEDNTVLVTFNVGTDHQLTDTTRATIQYRNLIGDRIVQLTPGTAAGQPLEKGGTIDVSQTASALDLDTLLNGFRPLFAGLSPTQINELSGQLIQVLQGQESAVSTLVEQVASFTTTIGDREQLVGQVIRNLNAVLGTVDQHKGDVAALVDQLDVLLRGLDRQDTQILDAATRIDGFATRADTLLQRATGDLREDLVQLAIAARGINSESATLSRVLAQLPKHYRKLSNTASYGNYFNFYLCGVRVQTGLPGGPESTTPWFYSDAPRCDR